MNTETAVVPTGTMQLTAPTPQAPTNVEVTASNQADMTRAQEALILWAEAKVNEVTAERLEAQQSYEAAVKHKWRAQPIKRMLDKAIKRCTFYEKVLAALRAGYTIVPNFPVTAFAIRTDKGRPLAMLTASYYERHTQHPDGLPQGEGEYRNPFPLVLEHVTAQRTATTSEKKEYWAEDWKDLEFPLTMAKPQIIEATSRTMALKIFDDLGVLPGFAPGEGTKPPKGDPMIVGRIFDKSRELPYNRANRHHVTFIVAWHLNTREI